MKRAIIIVKAGVVAQANLKSKTFVDLVGGDFTWTASLEQISNPGVVVAYVCGWTTTDVLSIELITRLKEIEVNLNDKVRIFNTTNMTPEEEWTELVNKLAQLGLQRAVA